MLVLLLVLVHLTSHHIFCAHQDSLRQIACCLGSGVGVVCGDAANQPFLTDGSEGFSLLKAHEFAPSYTVCMSWIALFLFCVLQALCCIAGLTLLFLSKERRRTLALYMLARLAQCAYNSLKQQGQFHFWGSNWAYGDALLFALSSAQVTALAPDQCVQVETRRSSA